MIAKSLLLLVAFGALWGGRIQVAGGPVAVYVAIALLLFFVCAHIAVRQDRTIAAPLHGAAVALGLWAVVSAAWSPYPDHTAYIGRVYLYMAALCFATSNLIENPRDLRRFAVAYSLGALVIAVSVWHGVLSGDAAGQRQRYAALNLNGNWLAYSMVSAIPFLRLLYGWRGDALKTGLLKPTVASAMTLIASAMVLTGCRSAVVALMAYFGWLFVRKFPRKPGLTMAYSAVVVGLVVAVLGTLPDGPVERMATASDQFYAGDLSGREAVWPVAWETFLRRPWTGVGAGVFAEVNGIGIPAHNIILQTLAELGLPGALLFLLVLADAIRRRAGMGAAGEQLLEGSLVIWLVVALSGHWELSPATWMLFGLAGVVRFKNSSPRSHCEQAHPSRRLASPPSVQPRRHPRRDVRSPGQERD